MSTSSHKELIDNVWGLAKTCGSIAELTDNSSILRSVKDYKACLSKIRDDESKHSKFFDLYKPFFDLHKEDLNKPMFKLVDEKQVLVDAWLHASTNKSADSNGYHGPVLYIAKDKAPSYCLPVSECYTAAIKLFKEQPAKYPFLPARVLYYFLSSMAVYQHVLGDDFVNEIAVSADRFKEKAAISGTQSNAFDFEGLMSGLPAMLSSLGLEEDKTKEIFDLVKNGADPNELMGVMGKLVGNVAGGDMAGIMSKIMSMAGGMGASNLDDDALPVADQD